MTSRSIATALAAWCGTGEVNGANLSSFYKEHRNDNYKETIQAAKATDQPKGLRSFIALHADLIACRIAEGNVLYVRAATMPRLELDDISELSTMLKSKHGVLPIIVALWLQANFSQAIVWWDRV